MKPIIEVRDVHYTYQDGTQALKGINLKIPSNSKTVLLGENGSGKSTLLLHLNALHIALKGEVLLDGKRMSSADEHWIRTQVGLVFQDPDDQIFSPTVFEDVAFGPLNMGLNSQEIETRVSRALHAVDMNDLQHKAPHHLSYGQKKRVAIAGVLAMDPEVIVLDEPAAFLDPQGQDSLWLILDDLHKNGKTIIIATHDVNMAAEWAEHVIILKNGKTLIEGSPEVLVDQNVIKNAHLHLPIVARLYKKINPSAEKLPWNISQAAKLLEG